MPIPQWLLEHLEETTGGVYTTGLSRHPKIRMCKRCGDRVIVGLTDMWQNVCADVYTVIEKGAVWAVLNNRKIWRLYGHSWGYSELWERDQFNWSDWPAGRIMEATGRVNLIIEHRCWQPCPDRFIEGLVDPRNRLDDTS